MRGGKSEGRLGCVRGARIVKSKQKKAETRKTKNEADERRRSGRRARARFEYSGQGSRSGGRIEYVSRRARCAVCSEGQGDVSGARRARQPSMEGACVSARSGERSGGGTLVNRQERERFEAGENSGSWGETRRVG